jgi:hypothetical protein
LENDKGGIHISNVTGEVSGVTYGGTGNITGKNIVVGSGTINVSEQQLSKIPNEYAESLRAFSEAVTNQLKNRQILEDHVKSINQSISELAKAIEGVKPGAEQEIDYEKQKNIEAKTGSLIQRVLNVLPQAAETATTLHRLHLLVS